MSSSKGDYTFITTRNEDDYTFITTRNENYDSFIDEVRKLANGGERQERTSLSNFKTHVKLKDTGRVWSMKEEMTGTKPETRNDLPCRTCIVCRHANPYANTSSKSESTTSFELSSGEQLYMVCPFYQLLLLHVIRQHRQSSSVHLPENAPLKISRTTSWYLNSHTSRVEPNSALILSRASKQLGRILLNHNFQSGHTANPIPNSTIHLNVVRELLKACSERHGLCNTPHPDTDSVQLLLIDVRNRCLVEASTKHRYVALSYVLGGKFFQTTKRNVQILMEAGALSNVEGIPRSYHDAIHCVRQLGEEYLWIDQLCIVQDDEKQKHHQIMHMDSIYRQALLTVISLSNSNAGMALPGIMPGSRPPIRAAAQDVLIEPVPMEFLLQDSAYESRGWTFQERIMSRRCLYLTDSQAVFQCREGFITESVWTAPEPRYNLLHQRSGNAPIHVEPIDPSQPLITTIPGPVGFHPMSLLTTYHQLVASYTNRQLSYPSDALNAFNGILAHVRARWSTKFAAGLPLAIMDLSLFWIPVRRGGQRRSQFPSWSWAGWDGPVQYVECEIHGRARPKCAVAYVAHATPDMSTGLIYSDSTLFWHTLNSVPFHLLEGTNWSEDLEVLIFEAEAIGLNNFVISEFTVFDKQNRTCGIVMGDVPIIDKACSFMILLSQGVTETYKSFPFYYDQVGLKQWRDDPHGADPKVFYHNDFDLETENNPKSAPALDFHYWSQAQSKLKLFNFMLVRRKSEDSKYYERVCVGYIHGKAWNNAAPQKRLIKLV